MDMKKVHEQIKVASSSLCPSCHDLVPIIKSLLGANQHLRSAPTYIIRQEQAERIEELKKVVEEVEDYICCYHNPPQHGSEKLIKALAVLKE